MQRAKQCGKRIIMKHIVSWSGGKDSTATIILAHMLGLPIDLIIICIVWFDKKRGITGEHPEHITWIHNYAKPLFESWGYKVEIVSSDEDYLTWFFKTRTEKCRNKNNIGKYVGFPMGGFCNIQGEKTRPIKNHLKSLGDPGIDYCEYVGICADEKERIKTLEKSKGKRSLLAENGYTQTDAKRLCEKHGLLSPTYKFANRGGCWFCPNQGIEQFARIKQYHPELWNELEILSRTENMVSRGFKYGKTFQTIDAEVDAYIENQKYAAMQMTIWDAMEE